MTEPSSLPFLPSVDEDDAAAPVAPEEEPRNRRPLVLALGFALAVLGLGGYLLLGGPGEDTEELALPAPDVAAAPADAGTPTDAGAPPAQPELLPATFNGVVARDPFDALVSEPTTGSGEDAAGSGSSASDDDAEDAAATTIAAAGSTSATRPSSGTTGDPASAGAGAGDTGLVLITPLGPELGAVAPGGSTTAAPGGAAAQPAPPATPVAGRKVLLIDVVTRDGVRHAQTSVDGEVHTSKQGDVFAATFRVLLVDENCASYLNGDEQFALCEGQGLVL